MKKSVLFTVLIVLLITSCGKSKMQTNDQTDLTTRETAYAADSSNFCLDLDDVIYPETAMLWINSWLIEHPGYNESGDQELPLIYFSNSELQQLKSIDSTSTPNGISMYYILQDASDEVPSLALVNIEKCEIKECQSQDCILMYDLEAQKSSFISDDTFQTYSGLWKEKADKKEAANPAYVAVYAYNYSWAKITEAANTGGEGIWVQYGLRTLGPLDQGLYEIGAQESNATGNIVYCNIVYEIQPEVSRENLDLSEQESFDFAKPCPKFCPTLTF